MEAKEIEVGESQGSLHQKLMSTQNLMMSESMTQVITKQLESIDSDRSTMSGRKSGRSLYAGYDDVDTKKGGGQGRKEGSSGAEYNHDVESGPRRGLRGAEEINVCGVPTGGSTDMALVAGRMSSLSIEVDTPRSTNSNELRG